MLNRLIFVFFFVASFFNVSYSQNCPSITIVRQPTSFDAWTGYSGTANNFSVYATSTGGALTYQWERSIDNGLTWLPITASLDAGTTYSSFNTRPNQKFVVAVYDKYGNKHEIEVNSDNYIKTNNEYNKSITLLNLPIPEQELKEIKLKEDAIRNAELAKLSKQFVRTIDSLKSLTTDYVELHHPFDQVYIIKKDLNDYYKLIERVKSMKGKKIVIVSAADCNGALEYNEDLSLRRAKRIFKSLANSYNNTIIKQVGERELLKDCGEARKDIEEQVVNRYSYIFILNK